MNGIIFATEEEAAPFLAEYGRGRFEDLVEGETSFDDDLVVTITGLGKIKSTLRTERFLQAHQPERLIHAGTCTALKDDLKIGELVAADQVFEGDRIELEAPSYPRMPLEVPFDGIPTGILVTQDHVAQDNSERSYWQRIADMSDMSGYAVAYVSATYGIPCHIIKVVTGYISDDSRDFRKTLTSACETMGAFLLDRIERMEEPG